jgi:hypothetical protein
MKHKALNQLLCAAVINQSFRQTLLSDPVQAIDGGYHGQAFPLSLEERALLSKIRVGTLEELAAEVHAWISGNGHHDQARSGEVPGRRSRAGVVSRYKGAERSGLAGIYRRRSGEPAGAAAGQPVPDLREPAFA